MASLMYAIKCPCCGLSALEDDYYKSHEKYICCMRCGYYYTKTIEKYTKNSIEYKEEKSEGHGVFVLEKKDGSREKVALNNSLSSAQLEEFTASFMDSNVNQERSYLVSFENGVFTILAGNPPENFTFHLKSIRKRCLPSMEFLNMILWFQSRNK